MTSVLLNYVVSPELDNKYGFVKSEDSYIQDHDMDGIEERVHKFDRYQVQSILETGDSVVLTVSGKLYDGGRFEGSDRTRVLGDS